MDKELIIIPDEWYVDYIYTEAVRLYFSTKASWIIVSWSPRDPVEMQSYWLKLFLEGFLRIVNVNEQVENIMKLGVSNVIHEDKSRNTKENAVFSAKLIKKEFPDVQNVYLVWSIEWILRKYLTFKKTFADEWMDIGIRLNPIFKLFPLKLTLVKLILIPSEFLRIIKYRMKWDL